MGQGLLRCFDRKRSLGSGLIQRFDDAQSASVVNRGHGLKQFAGVEDIMETERLLFRGYTPDDLDLLLGMTSDPEIMRYIRHGHPWTREETIETLNRFLDWNAKGIGLYLAFSKEDGGFVGHSGLVQQIVEGIQELEVGYWVVKDLWGKGYGYEQANGWKEYGFNRLGEKRLISLIQLENIGSRKVAEKNGMKYERDIDLNGKRVAVYSIEKS